MRKEVLRNTYREIVELGIREGRIPISDREDFMSEIDGGLYDDDMRFFVENLAIWWDLDDLIAALERHKAEMTHMVEATQ